VARDREVLVRARVAQLLSALPAAPDVLQFVPLVTSFDRPASSLV
jgi:hypothetical protein